MLLKLPSKERYSAPTKQKAHAAKQKKRKPKKTRRKIRKPEFVQLAEKYRAYMNARLLRVRR